MILDADRGNEFRCYVRSVLGLSDGTADSYVAYVNGACRCIGKSIDEIVSSNEALVDAFRQIDRSAGAKKTLSNYKRGVRAYFRFIHGEEFGPKPEEANPKCGIDHELPYEIKQQLNEIEFRISDGEASFWHRVMDVAVLVLTIVSSILASTNMPLTSKVSIGSALVFGLIGLGALIPIIRRPIRQSRELYEYGKSLQSGNACSFEFNPVELTSVEKICTNVAKAAIPIALLCLVVAIGAYLCN